MESTFDENKVKEILARRDTMLIRPKRIAGIIDEIIGDDLNARGKLLNAIIGYDRYQNTPPFSQDEEKLRQAWAIIKLDLDEDLQTYLRKMCKRNHNANQIL